MHGLRDRGLREPERHRRAAHVAVTADFKKDPESLQIRAAVSRRPRFAVRNKNGRFLFSKEPPEPKIAVAAKKKTKAAKRKNRRDRSIYATKDKSICKKTP